MTKRSRMDLLSTTLLMFGCFLLALPAAHAAKKAPTPTSCKGKSWNQAKFSHRLYNKLLKTYVSNGRVNYNSLRKKRKKLDVYLCRLANTNAKKIKKYTARFSFWINAYNAITLRAVLDRLPKSSSAQKGFSVAKKKFNFWKGTKYQVSGRWYTLDQIENKVIRKRFPDPRLHFALVCAARGCPHLANRAYTSSRLYRMLNKNTRKYLASPSGSRLDRKKMVIHLSKLFNWYKQDFVTKKYAHRLLFVAKYSGKADRKFIRANYKKLTTKWLKYSWKLNIR